MHLLRIGLTGLLSTVSVAASLDLTVPKTLSIDIDPSTDPQEALAQLQQHAYKTLQEQDAVAGRAIDRCSLAHASVRRDWYVGSEADICLRPLTWLGNT